MDANEQRVLATFIKDGAIPTFPAKLTKQLVLWRWVVERFELGRDYPEADVNDVLRPINPDVATVRRALVDHGLMTRRSGIYRRVDTSR
jgi:hypothetical protein